MELWSFLDNSLQLQTLNFFHIKLYLTLSVIPSGKTKNNASFLCHSLIIVDTNKYKKIKKNMTQIKKNPTIFNFTNSTFTGLVGL